MRTFYGNSADSLPHGLMNNTLFPIVTSWPGFIDDQVVHSVFVPGLKHEKNITQPPWSVTTVSSYIFQKKKGYHLTDSYNRDVIQYFQTA